MGHFLTTKLIAALSCVALAGCGGGGGGAAPPAYDLTGDWKLFLTPTGGPETGPLPVFLSQTGSAINGVAVNGSMNGASFSIMADAGSFTIDLAGTAASSSSATGTVTLGGSIVGTGTFRLERFQPTGTMSASGTLNGTAIAETSSTAIGQLNYSDIGLSTLTSVVIVLTNEAVDFEIELSPSGLAVGTLAVPGTVSAEVLFRNDAAIVSVVATSGTVTVTSYDANGIAGSYSLTTASGTITGSFDVSFDLASYDP